MTTHLVLVTINLTGASNYWIGLYTLRCVLVTVTLTGVSDIVVGLQLVSTHAGICGARHI